MATQTILVVGATGQQGRAVIRSLLALPPQDPPLRILAMTRNRESAAAKAVAASAGDAIELVQGDLFRPDDVFSQLAKGSVSAMFLYTANGSAPEDAQAIPFIDAAARHGVQHIVYSSVDRGGDERSWVNPTDVKHFYEKHNVELHLRDELPSLGGAGKAPPTWTILRPVCFFDNMNPGAFCSLFTALWAAAVRPETTLQFVGVRDVGALAARVLAAGAAGAVEQKWRDRAVGLAGDELTLDEARQVFKRVVGRELPSMWTLLGRGVMWALADIGKMCEWWEKEGAGVDIAALRTEEAGLQDFETWLRESSGWKKDTEGGK